jgi:hypothetical protein
MAKVSDGKSIGSGSQLHFGTRYLMEFGMAVIYSINDLLNLVAREGAKELRLEPGRVIHLEVLVQSGAVQPSFRSKDTQRKCAALPDCPRTSPRTQRKEPGEEEVGPVRYEQEMETLKNTCGTAYSGV